MYFFPPIVQTAEFTRGNFVLWEKIGQTLATLTPVYLMELSRKLPLPLAPHLVIFQTPGAVQFRKAAATVGHAGERILNFL